VAEALVKSAPAVADNPVTSQIAQPFNGNGHSNGYTNGNGHVNGNGDGANSGAAAPALESTAIAALTRTGLATIDAVLEVERHAQARGLRDFTFGADNIQKIWMSLFIDIRKNGGRS
jgi:hypothetical protein